MTRRYRLLISACLVAASQPLASQVPAAERFAVPSTVSSEAAERLRAFYRIAAAAPAPVKPVSLEDWDRNRQQSEAGPTKLGKALLEKLSPTIKSETIGGVPVLRIRPTGWRPTGRVLVYLHGGGYVTFSAASTEVIAASMAKATHEEVISIDYSLAPRAKWPAVTDEVLSVWRGLLSGGAQPDQVGFFGDSAGGGLIAGAVLKMRDQNLPLPGGLVLLSPWSDLTAAGDSYRTLGQVDPILRLESLRWSADAYADRADQARPYVSPVYGDFSRPFPATLIQAGTREMLLSDAVRLYQAIGSGGHDVVLDIYEGMPHAFHYFVGDAPEGKTAYARAASFFSSRLGTARGHR